MMIEYNKAICYSGYRKNQSPINKTYPSYNEVLEDLKILSKTYQYIRMYDPYQHAQTVLKVLKDHKIPLKVMIGVEPKGEISNPNCPWGGLHSDEAIIEHKKFNIKQLDALAELCNQYPDYVLAASVGNECTSDWHGNLMDPKTIAEHVFYLKSKVNCQVTFCEGAYYWLTKNQEAAKVVDFISIHSYPLWLKIPIDQAVNYTINDYQINRNAYPNKQIIFTEFGWTTQANQSMNQHEANEVNQQRYLNEMNTWSRNNQVTMFLFEAFDEPWKGSDDQSEPEKHWGIYDVDRKPKLYARKLSDLDDNKGK